MLSVGLPVNSRLLVVKFGGGGGGVGGVKSDTRTLDCAGVRDPYSTLFEG